MTGAGWTREKPTAAGWYWWRLDGVVAVVHITQPHWLSGTEPHKFIMYWYGQQYQLNQVGGEFKGPITPDSFQQGRVAGLVRGAQLVRWHKSCAFEADPALALERAAKDIESVASQIIQPQQAQDEKGVGDGN